MSDKSLYIDCYKVDGQKAVELFNNWKSEVKSKRDKVFQEMLDKTGAIAWRERSSFGSNSTVVGDLVFKYDSEQAKLSHVKHVDRSVYDDERVVCLRGKLNSKAGKAFNIPMDDANESLKSLLDFSDWITDMFDIDRSGLGHSTDRGTAMISTAIGYYNGVMIATIPSDRCDGASKKPIVPEFFESITYGEMHDITHAN